jgi:hypothetical protein
VAFETRILLAESAGRKNQQEREHGGSGEPNGRSLRPIALV